MSKTVNLGSTILKVNLSENQLVKGYGLDQFIEELHIDVE